MSASDDMLELLATGALDVLQIPLSILHPDSAREVLAEARAPDVGVVLREPLANGYLTGAFDERTRFGVDDQRALWPRERHLLHVRKARALEFLVRPGRSLAQPGVSTVIPGSANREQLAWNLAASDVPPLSEGELARVAELQRTNFGLPVG